jgi:serine phosphatase RsbU (regulator of sigma subunit)
MKKIRLSAIIFILLSCFTVLPAFPQDAGMLALDGLVYGYNYDYSKRLLKKEKQIKVEGVLDNVTVSIREEGKAVKTVKTNSNGLFYVKIMTGKAYSVEFSKQGYSTILMTIDLTAVPKEIASKGIVFSGAELLMNSFQSKTKSEDPSIGKLYYSTAQNCLGFEENKEAPKKQREYIENSASLMLRAVQKNKGRLTETGETPAEEKIVARKDLLIGSPGLKEPVRRADTLSRILPGIKSSLFVKKTEINRSDLQSMEADLKNARIQFEKDKLNAVTPADSMLLHEREQVLNALENELAGAKKIIELQDNTISVQNRFLVTAIASVVLLSALLLIIFRYSRERKKTYLILEEKNRNITDSINYASRIQGAILPSEEELKRQLPQSFIFFKPKDVVSGDFYWVNTVKGKTVIACVDCTGHGVPGAFMSLIGNTLLNEIVVERQITEPSKILRHLHLGIVKALQQSSHQQQVEDGMDLSLCVIDPAERKMTYAGAMNPVYIVKDGAVSLLKPDIRSIGGLKEMSEGFEFGTQSVDIVKGSSVYMFTDGYMDQFGGPDNKKFNIPNFKKMLLEFQSADLSQQKNTVERTIKEWQGTNRQIDDMLVIGFRL